jgi:hypothetical protein
VWLSRVGEGEHVGEVGGLRGCDGQAKATGAGEPHSPSGAQVKALPLLLSCPFVCPLRPSTLQGACSIAGCSAAVAGSLMRAHCL